MHRLNQYGTRIDVLSEPTRASPESLSFISSCSMCSMIMLRLEPEIRSRIGMDLKQSLGLTCSSFRILTHGRHIQPFWPLATPSTRSSSPPQTLPPSLLSTTQSRLCTRSTRRTFTPQHSVASLLAVEEDLRRTSPPAHSPYTSSH
jgi:hypothetical protein